MPSKPRSSAVPSTHHTPSPSFTCSGMYHTPSRPHLSPHIKISTDPSYAKTMRKGSMQKSTTAVGNTSSSSSGRPACPPSWRDQHSCLIDWHASACLLQPKSNQKQPVNDVTPPTGLTLLLPGLMLLLPGLNTVPATAGT